MNIKKPNIKFEDFDILIICLIAAGYLSILMRQELSWDFRNYHLYGAYAFLNGRIGIDIAPSGLQSYVNPLLDIPYYLMFEYLNDYPRLVSFLMGTPAGLMAFVVYKICRSVFLPKNKMRVFMVSAATLIGVTGASAGSLLGRTHNDITVALVVLIALYLMLDILTRDARQTKKLALAGVLAGAITGLKLTAGTYVLAFALLLLIFHKRFTNPVKSFLIYSAACAAGFLVTNGFWMWILWSNFQNPFFPYFNGWFKSEFAQMVNIRDTRLLPTTIQQWLFYPWFFNVSRDPADPFGFWGACEAPYFDYRFQYLYIATVGWFIFNFAPFVRSKFNDFKSEFQDWIDFDRCMILFCFCTAAYIIWMAAFSFIRYAIAIENLCGIAIIVFLFVFLFGLFRSRFIFKAIILSFIALLLSTTHYPPWGSIDYEEQLFNKEFIQFKQDDLLILLGNGQSFLVPLFAQNVETAMVGIPWYDGMNYNERSEFGKRFKEKLSTREEVWVVFNSATPMDLFNKPRRRCVRHDIDWEWMFFCKVPVDAYDWFISD